MTENSISEDTIHLRDHIEVLKRRRMLLLILFVSFFAAAALYTFIQPQVYEAVIEIEVFEPRMVKVNNKVDSGSFSFMTVETALHKLKGNTLLKTVADNLRMNVAVLEQPAKIDVTFLGSQYHYYGNGKPCGDYIVHFSGNEFVLLNDSDYEIGRAESGGTVENGPVSVSLSFQTPVRDDTMKIRVQDMNSVLQELKNQVSVSRIPDTRLIRVSVYNSSGQTAADIARNIYSVFTEQTRTVQKRLIKNKMDFIRQKRDLYAERLEASSGSVERLKQKWRIHSIEAAHSRFEAELERLRTARTDAQLHLRQVQQGIVPYTYTLNPDMFRKVMEKKGAPENNEKDTYHIITDKPKLKALETSYLSLIALCDEKIEECNKKLAMLPTMKKKLTQAEEDTAFNRNMHTLFAKQYEELHIQHDSVIENTAIVEYPLVPQTPVAPDRGLNLILGFISAAVLSAAAVFFIEYFDNTFRSIDEIEEETGEKVAAVIPFINKKKCLKSGDSRQVRYMDSHSSTAEAFKMLATSVEFEDFADNVRTVEVCSSNPGEGKSTVAANLAVAAANFGHNVVLVDSDTKKGIQHNMFGCSRTPGFSDIINGSVPLGECVQDSTIPNLHLITSGHIMIRKDQVLAMDAIVDFMEKLKSQYDFVVIDSPPVLLVDDCIRIGKQTEGIMYTIGLGITSKPVVLRGLERFKKHSCRIIGICANDIRKKETYYTARETYLERIYRAGTHTPPLENSAREETWRIYTG